MEQFINQIHLRGNLEDLPKFSHENHGKKFYRFYLEVPRLSGTVDRLPVVSELSVLETLDLTAGSSLDIRGQIRSHNLSDDTGRHLLVFVFATEMHAEDGPPVNDVTILGNLCKMPTYRRTPLGREITDVMLAVPRILRRADYLPCILWGSTAYHASSCQVRDQIQISGRLQSRTYNKHTETGTCQRTTYEISALTAQIFPRNDP